MKNHLAKTVVGDTLYTYNGEKEIWESWTVTAVKTGPFSILVRNAMIAVGREENITLSGDTLVSFMSTRFFRKPFDVDTSAVREPFVPVLDDKLEVRDFIGSRWTRAHYCKTNSSGQVVCFAAGQTSFTGSPDETKAWREYRRCYEKP